MDKELKAKWVAALRSGKHEQAKGTLKDCSGGFCCLGVLLDVSGRGQWNASSYEFENDEGQVKCCDGDLGKSGRLEFDIPDEIETTLVHMNDGEGKFAADAKTFAEIADYIEANL